jgi:dipeptidyl aminopeptidase/acylaminoacyl peptidase
MAINRWILAALVATCAGTATPAQDRAPEPFPHLEVRGPKGVAGKPWGGLDALTFSRDGTRMAAAADASIFVWDVADGKEVTRMQLPRGYSHHNLAFSADGKTLVWCQGSGSIAGDARDDPKVRTFDVATGRQVREGRRPKRMRTFTPDGTRMVCHSDHDYARLDVYDVATGKVVLVIEGETDCNATAFSPDGTLLAVHGGYGSLRLWDTRTGKLVRQFPRAATSGAGAHKFVTFSPDGTLLATGGHCCTTLDVWSVATGKRVCAIPSKTNFQGAALAPGGESVVCSETDGRPYLYHLIAEKVIHRFDPPAEHGYDLRFTPDGKRLAIIGPTTDRDPGVRQQSIFLLAVPARALNPAGAHVDDAPLETLWAEIGTDNDLKLQRILKAFRAAPKPAVALFGTQVLPARKAEQADLEQWIAALDDPAAVRRDQAMKHLQRAAHAYAPLLQARLEQDGPGERRNRLTFVLGQAKDEALPVALIKSLRVVALLEQMATPEARELLRALAGGAPRARLTVEARAALERTAKGK